MFRQIIINRMHDKELDKRLGDERVDALMSQKIENAGVAALSLEFAEESAALPDTLAPPCEARWLRWERRRVRRWAAAAWSP